MALTTNKPPVMEMKNLSKRFDATQALDDVSLDIYPGEVHAVVGENGAGKSTLIKIMTGIHPPDSGEIVSERLVGELSLRLPAKQSRSPLPDPRGRSATESRPQ